MIRPVAGLGVLKHDPVTVVGLAGNHCHAVIVLSIHAQILFVDLGHLLHGHDPLAVYNGHVQRIFQILINGSLRDLFGESGTASLKVIMVKDQGHIVQIVETLDIVNIRSRGKTGVPGLALADGETPQIEGLLCGGDGRFWRQTPEMSQSPRW